MLHFYIYTGVEMVDCVRLMVEVYVVYGGFIDDNQGEQGLMRNPCEDDEEYRRC